MLRRSETPTYKSWYNMVYRCTNAKHQQFADYGGRGIKVCKRWMIYENFLLDMGERPEGMTLDRFPNIDGNYTPGNCRWATRRQQSFGRRKFRCNTSGCTGVCWVKNSKYLAGGYWIATAGRTSLYHGPSFVDACTARKTWEKENGHE